MHIASINISFFLPGCRSLKEKRRRLRPLADTFAHSQHIAVAETGLQDQWQRSEWTFVILASDSAIIDATCNRIETYCQRLDAYITHSRRENLY